MCWVGNVNEEFLPVHWFEEDVNECRYLTIQVDVWTFVGSKTKQESFWFQQDGAPYHCTNRVLKYPQGKFKSRFISRRSECRWLAHRPVLNPLDYWCEGQVDSMVSKKQPKTHVELKIMLEELAATFD